MKKLFKWYSGFRMKMMEKVTPVSPLLMISFLVVFFFLWNLSFFLIAAGVIFREIIFYSIDLVFVYVTASLFTVMVMILIDYMFSGTVAVKVLNWIYLAVFAFSGIVRMIDWGAVYYDNQHIDSEFWFHAFYVDSTAFLYTKISIILMLIFVSSLVIFRKLSMSLMFFSERLRKDNSVIPEFFREKARLKYFSILSASLVLFVFFSCMIPQNISDQGSRLYVGSPMYHFTTSLFEYFFGPQLNNVEKLPETIISKLEKAGINLETVTPDFPLMRPSIYIDRKNISGSKPVLDRNTNVIIVFEESLSQYFIEEDELGYKGITDNLNEARSQGIYFRNMYESIFPTVRGMIATLGSSLYIPSKSTGIQVEGKQQRTWLPIFCRFQFLSDILKDYGYTSVHVQGGSGRFVGMSNAFTKNQNYSEFYAQESVEMLKFAGVDDYNVSNWGFWDEDVFGFSVDMLKNKKIQEPFMLTISTLDLHPPFTPKETTPAAKGNPLLNTLYSTDRAFGILWEYYKNSDLHKNTVLIVVSDHAMGGGDGLLELRRETLKRENKLSSENLMNDFITCFMVLPKNREYNGRTVDTFCSNLDIAPTLLDMMNIDTENSFLGMSVFADRKNYPNLIIAEDKLRKSTVRERLTDEQLKIIDEYSFTTDELNKFRAYMENLEMKRMIYPDLKK